MKISLLLLIWFTGFHTQAQAADKDSSNEALRCERLMGMVQGIVLPATTPGIVYPSGLKYEHGQEETYIAYFFGALRTPEVRETVSQQLGKSTFEAKLFFLHTLSFAMGITTLNLMQFMNSNQIYFEGQQDAHVMILLQDRSNFIQDVLLPDVLSAPADKVLNYFEELTAIGADFANVPGAYGLSVAMINFLRPFWETYQSSGGKRVSEKALAQTKFHAYANLLLEETGTDRTNISLALKDAIRTLKDEHPIAPYPWLLSQLAYRIELGQTVKNSIVFPTARWMTRQLLDELPQDFSALRETYPDAFQAYQQGADDLVFALSKVPTLLDASHTRKLKSLAGLKQKRKLPSGSSPSSVKK